MSVLMESTFHPTIFELKINKYLSTSDVINMNITIESGLINCEKYNITLSELNFNTSYGNVTCLEHAPTLSHSGVIRVLVLSAMAFVSLLGNIATMWNIRKNRSSRRMFRNNCSAIYALIFHLSVADILVTFFCIIGEAAWSYTVEWIAGDAACKLVKIFQMFSLYLSTNVLVLIGIDRWVAIKYPMKCLKSKLLNTEHILIFVYCISFLLSLPQGLIFHLQRGPFIEEFYQCVTFGSYTAKWQEPLYTTFTLVFMFIIPLLILVCSYLSTFRTISSSERIFRIETHNLDHVRRTDSNRQKLIHKAKMKSLRISIVIIAAFIICWTPYYIMMIIFVFLNPDKRLSEDLQSGIFFFGMSNSLINPLIYGAFQYQPIKKRRKYMHRREGSTYLHRSMSTNATICRNINNINPPTNLNNNNKLTNSQTNLHDSEWKNQEEISLMSLEKDLKTLDESVNQINLQKQRKLSRIFNLKLFQKKSSRPSNL